MSNMRRMFRRTWLWVPVGAAISLSLGVVIVYAFSENEEWGDTPLVLGVIAALAGALADFVLADSTGHD